MACLRRPVQLLLLLVVLGAASALQPTAAVPRLQQQRALRPAARRVGAQPRAALPPVLEQPMLLVAADMFGKTFLAGMSLALAGVVSTIFVGFLVQGNYEAIEQSFFDEQDAAIDDIKREAVNDDVKAFFADPPVEAPAVRQPEESEQPTA